MRTSYASKSLARGSRQEAQSAILLVLKELSMRRPGPRGHKRRESFGGSSVQALLEVTSVVRGERDLKSALATIVKTVAEALEFKTVVLNLYRAEFDDFCVTDVYGNRAARDALLGSTYEWAAWRHLLTEDFRRGGAYLIPHGSFDWREDVGARYVPEMQPVDDPDAWHPEDELFVPLEDSEGRMLAIFSVGEPRSGLRPNADELEVLCALAAHAAIAIETAQQAARTTRHRASLEQLLEVSSTLTAAQSTQAILETVCRGIHTALGFHKVSIDLVEETGLLRSRASSHRRRARQVQLAAERARPARVEPPLAARAALRPQRRGDGIHLGGRPGGPARSVGGTSAGASRVCEPGDDGG